MTVGGGWISDWSGVWAGGLRNRDTFRYLLYSNLELDLDTLMGLPTTTAFVEGQIIQGRDATEDFGDFQVVSNIDSPDREQIAEAWIETLFDTTWLRAKFGKIEANSEFAWMDEAGAFVHSTAGFSPTIVGFLSYPDPGVGALVEGTLDLGDGVTSALKVGIFDGALAEGRPTGKLGFGTFFSDDEANSYHTIVELDVRYPSLGPLGGGRFAVAGWYHSATFDRFDGSTTRGTEGAYLVWDQKVWGEEVAAGADFQGLALAASIGTTDEAISDAHTSWFLGITYTGLIPGRDQDVLGFALNHVDLSDDPAAGFAKNETAWELQYRMQLTPWLAVVPLVTYVDRPSGDPAIDQTWIGTLRMDVVF